MQMLETMHRDINANLSNGITSITFYADAPSESGSLAIPNIYIYIRSVNFNALTDAINQKI